MFLHKGMPNWPGRIAFLPCPLLPAGWSTLTLTPFSCMHICLVDSEFPKRGTWQANSKSTAGKKTALRRQSQRSNPSCWGLCRHAYGPTAHLCLQAWIQGGFAVPPLHVSIADLKLQLICNPETKLIGNIMTRPLYPHHWPISALYSGNLATTLLLTLLSNLDCYSHSAQALHDH